MNTIILSNNSPIKKNNFFFIITGHKISLISLMELYLLL